MLSGGMEFVGEVVSVPGGSVVVGFWRAVFWLNVYEAVMELVEGGEACLLSLLF